MSTPMSQTVALDNQLEDADGFYEALLDAHAGLSAEQSAALNARLILLLANQVGHAGVLEQCIALAKAPSNA
ncbi:MAG: DUF2783 domain-containing protein [Burkholderiaceae bacterium]